MLPSTAVNLRRRLRAETSRLPPGGVTFHSPPFGVTFADFSGRLGFWCFAGHVLAVWAIALSNACLGLAGLWAVWFRRRLRWSWRSTAALVVPLGVYAVFYAISILTSLEPETSARELKSLLGLATLPLAILLVRGAGAVRRIFDLLILMMVALAIYGIGQYFLTDYGPLDRRIPGPFSHYMTFSGVLLLGFFLLLGRIACRRGWRRPWNWLALGAITTTLVLTLTRGAWVAAIVSFVIVLMLRARRLVPVYLVALSIFGVLVLSFGPETWRQRISSITDPRDESNYDRLSMLQAGMFMVSERPLFGIGPGMVEQRYPIYRHPTAPRVQVKHLHNSFLQIAAERGLLSLAAYLWLMVAGLRLSYRGYRDGGGGASRQRRAKGMSRQRRAQEPASADLYLGVLLVLVGFNLAGLFEANWRDSEIQRLVLFLLAVPLCLSPDRSELLLESDRDFSAPGS